MTQQAQSRQVARNIALPWFEAGCSVVPIRSDGTKRPTRAWEHLQRQLPVRAQVESWWSGDTVSGVAVICGAVSGNLEMTELEGAATDGESLLKIGTECLKRGLDGLWSRLLHEGYVEWTPSGGLHILYRIGDHEVPGNTKIASTREGKTLAETRGEGGYVIVAPTPGTCHQSGEPWSTVAGTPGTLPTLTWEQRCGIHSAISDAINELPPPPAAIKRDTLLPATGDRPGDDFNVRASWDEPWFTGQGWQIVEQRGQETLWARPGKSPREGHSASTGYAGDADRLYVWSTSAGLPTEQPLSKFYVYAHYHHRGDFAAATKDLSRQGYGTPTSGDEWIRAALTSSARAQSIGELESAEKVPQKTSLLEFFNTDSGNADRMYATRGHLFKFVPSRNKWIYWDGSSWQVDYQGAHVMRACEQMARDMYEQAVATNNEAAMKYALKCQSSDAISSMVKLLRGREGICVGPDWFDADPTYLNLHNGIMNIETGELGPHDPERGLTKKFNASYNPDAIAPRWDQYLKEVLPDEDMRDFLQRMVGYTLMGRPVERALAILHGPGGTGKSRFIEVLSELFGSYGVTAAESLFRSKRESSGPTNDLNDLRGARLASVSELDHGVKMDEALVKRLTGFDRVTSRAMYEENTTWMPQCVIWLATNHHFRINSDDGAIWDRIKVIPFNEKIPAAMRDPFILDKLLAEADGILNWALEGLRKYRERGLEPPAGVLNAVNSYKVEQDIVIQFLNDSVEEERLFMGPDEDIEKVQLYRMYVEWCGDQQERGVLGQMRFNRRMMALGYQEFKRSRKMWRGLGMGNRGLLGTM